MTQTTHIPESKYKEILTLMPIACVDIILVVNNKFLLVKRKNKPAQGEWCLPGGRILKNETFESAVARKLKEETNLEVSTLQFVGVENAIFPDGPFETTNHSVSITFLVTPISSDLLKLDNQSEEYAWFSEIDENWIPLVKNSLRKAKW